MSKATELRELASLTTISSGQIEFATDIKISGDLITTGNTITITADTLNISDPNITLASGAANSSVADGAGITIDGADVTFAWDANNQRMSLNKSLNVTGNNIYLAETRLSTSGTGELGVGYGLTGTGNIFALYDNTSNRFSVARTGMVNALALTTSGSITANTGVTINAGKMTVRDGGYPYLELGISSTNYFRAVHDNPNDSLVFQKYGLTGNIMTLHGGSGVGVSIGNESNSFNLNVHGEVTANQYNNDEVRHSVAPALSLDFVNTKRLDPRITFYRSSVATYYDSKGVLRYASHNEPRFDHDPATGESKGLLIEDDATNYLATANHGATAWGGGNRSIVPNATVSPDGTMNAYALYAHGPADHSVAITSTMPSTTSTVIRTVSIYAKAGNLPGIQIRNRSQAGTFSYSLANFDLVNGTVTQGGSNLVSNIKNEIKYVGKGWYRCSVSCSFNDAGVTTSYMEVQTFNGTTHSFTGTGEEYVYIWGPNLEIANYTSSYIPSNIRPGRRASSARYHDENGILRTAPAQKARYGYGYDGTYANHKWVETGLIVEPASTNLLYHSSTSSDLYGDVMGVEAIWTKTNSSTDVTAPDGGKYTTKAVTGTTGNTFFWTTGAPVTYVNGSYYTHSVYMRTATGTTATISLSVYPQVRENGSHNKTVTVTDQWTRYEISFKYNSALGKPYVSVVSPQQSRTFYFWGWQVEQQAKATSYITTLGAATTRAADNVSPGSSPRAADYALLKGDKFSAFYGNEGTLFVDANTIDAGSVRRYAVLFAGSVNVGGYLSLASYNGKAWLETFNGATANLFSSLAPQGQYNGKIASAFDSTGNTFAFNGTVINTTASSLVNPIDAYELQIGSLGRTTQNTTGYIKKIAYYADRLSDAQLVALTEND